jgi:hypothetical protein
MDNEWILLEDGSWLHERLLAMMMERDEWPPHPEYPKIAMFTHAEALAKSAELLEAYELSSDH